MITEKKYKILRWTTIILGALTLSMLATIGYHLFQTNKAQGQITCPQFQSDRKAEKFSGRYFHDQLDLTEGQTEEFKNINNSFRQQAKEINIKLSEQRSQMLAELRAPKSDTVKLNKLSAEIGNLHGSLKQLTWRYYLNLKKISTPEQLQKLEQLFKDVLYEMPMHRGRGQHGCPNRK